MKTSNITMIICSIMLGLIIYESVIAININNENKKLRESTKEYLALKEEINNYEKIKNDYTLVINKRNSIQENVDEVNEKINNLNTEITDYHNKIDWLNKELNLSK